MNACEVFVYTENLQAEPGDSKARKPARRRRPPSGASTHYPSSRARSEMAVQDDGWAFLGTLGNRLRQLDPGFDPRTYGHKQLSLLIRELDAFEVKQVKSQEGTSPIYVRLKE